MGIKTKKLMAAINDLLERQTTSVLHTKSKSDYSSTELMREAEKMSKLLERFSRETKNTFRGPATAEMQNQVKNILTIFLRENGYVVGYRSVALRSPTLAEMEELAKLRAYSFQPVGKSQQVMIEVFVAVLAGKTRDVFLNIFIHAA